MEQVLQLKISLLVTKHNDTAFEHLQWKHRKILQRLMIIIQYLDSDHVPTPNPAIHYQLSTIVAGQQRGWLVQEIRGPVQM